MAKYLAGYMHKRTEVVADSLYAAKVLAVKDFNPPKSKRHMVWVQLVEVDGRAVKIDPASL